MEQQWIVQSVSRRERYAKLVAASQTDDKMR